MLKTLVCNFDEPNRHAFHINYNVSFLVYVREGHLESEVFANFYNLGQHPCHMLTRNTVLPYKRLQPTLAPS